MLYDLNQFVNETEDVDYFTIGGVPYELGPIPEKTRKAILSINPKGDVATSWRPIIAWLLEERNQRTPELTDALISAIIPIIAKKIHESHQ